MDLRRTAAPDSSITFGSAPGFERLLGESTVLRDLEQQIEAAAQSDVKVLITGESGVGKEIVARFVHGASRRSRLPLVVINCAGVPDSLLESELFGHVRGSFTGAYRDRPGMLETGNGGTVFLDEVGEMSLRMQALLLRFLETGEIQRVGADRQQMRVDVRVLAATNRNLRDCVTGGSFRGDLYYRLNVVHLNVPPLRERSSDVPILLKAFLEAYGHRQGTVVPTIGADAMAALQSYHWPGNVRELRNTAERLLVGGGNRGHVTVDDLPYEIRAGRSVVATNPLLARPWVADHLCERMTKGESFWAVVYTPFMARDITRHDVREVISRGLEQTRGNYKHLVRLFNMSPGDYKSFLSFLRKHQCNMPFQRFRAPAHETPRLDFGDKGADPRSV